MRATHPPATSSNDATPNSEHPAINRRLRCVFNPKGATHPGRHLHRTLPVRKRGGLRGGVHHTQPHTLVTCGRCWCIDTLVTCGRCWCIDTLVTCGRWWCIDTLVTCGRYIAQLERDAVMGSLALVATVLFHATYMTVKARFCMANIRQSRPDSGLCRSWDPWRSWPRYVFFSSLLLSSLEVSDTKVYEP